MQQPKKPNSVPTQFVNQGLVNELYNSKFIPWRPLKKEKKVFNINIRSWQDAVNAIDQSLLSQTASTQPPKNRILL